MTMMKMRNIMSCNRLDTSEAYSKLLFLKIPKPHRHKVFSDSTYTLVVVHNITIYKIFDIVSNQLFNSL